MSNPKIYDIDKSILFAIKVLSHKSYLWLSLHLLQNYILLWESKALFNPSPILLGYKKVYIMLIANIWYNLPWS